jgi:hypothetical protein
MQQLRRQVDGEWHEPHSTPRCESGPLPPAADESRQPEAIRIEDSDA